jgi:hypothetical protein
MAIIRGEHIWGLSFIQSHFSLSRSPTHLDLFSPTVNLVNVIVGVGILGLVRVGTFHCQNAFVAYVLT